MSIDPDRKFMKKALVLARKGLGRTSPNPAVGAVLVKNGVIIASDYHRKAGTPHAEPMVLEKAGSASRGATLYVTLEPCCHTAKKTPPCTELIINSGIKRVVAAMLDPNPMVSGKGMMQLQNAGIITETGLMEDKARVLNEAFTKFITTCTPFVVLKMAQSLDGKIATARGESQWITGETSRQYVHRLRNEADAVLTGSGTVRKDNPSLDCRIRGGRNPYRVIVDSALRMPLSARVLGHGDGKTIIATTRKASDRKIHQIEKTGNRVLIVKEKNGRVDLQHLMKELARLEIISVMIEGGSSVAASALSGGIVDKVLFFIAPKIIGGRDSIPSVGGKSPVTLKNVIQLQDFKAIRLGQDILIQGYVRTK